MKQPELGRKISELRKAKGWTQEELVERCNISVRTIQRIETGEVMPRIYAVKTILEALDCDLNKISDDQDILDSLREP
ncbi:MAG: helix-turn-helix domain-containing protein [Mangrovibacterium sp.]